MQQQFAPSGGGINFYQNQQQPISITNVAPVQPRPPLIKKEGDYLTNLIQGTKQYIGQNVGTSQLPNVMLMNSVRDLPTIPTQTEMESQYGQNLEQIYQDHNKLIGMILTEEEDLIEMHK